MEYEELCRMDVLGLADTPVGGQEAVYEEFKEQLFRSPDGWYESSRMERTKPTAKDDCKHWLVNLGTSEI